MGFVHRKINGGLSVPNLQAYYTAAGIALLSHLHVQYQMPLWATIDLLLSSNTNSLPSLAPTSTSPERDGPCLAHSLQLWDSFKYLAGLISLHLPLLHLLHCPLFPPGRNNPHQFSWWTENSFTDIHFLCSPTRIFSFAALRSSHDIPLREHYSYLQLRHVLQHLIKSCPTPYTLTPFESLCRSCPQSSGLISLIYAPIIGSKKKHL